MVLFKKGRDLRKWLDDQQRTGETTGFVPTMGALHDGHISLIRASKKENPITVCSIFVNPTQFNDPKDFEKYPVTIEKDVYLLETSGGDVLFLPSVSEIYPDGLGTAMHYDLGFLETILEGKWRPGHFQGVCRVVHRLLDIVKPDRLYIGQKDYQQCMVIDRLIRLTGLDKSVRLVICPTLREASGLAMSSRNMRLDKDEKEKAATIYQCLEFIKQNLRPGNTDSLKDKAKAMLEANGFAVDYVEIALANDLIPATDWDGKQKLVALIAATLHEVRLIDNIVI